MNRSAYRRRSPICTSLFIAGVTVALVAGISAAAGLRLNLTGSIPPGIYRTIDSNTVRGAIVLVCLPANVAGPARQRGYIPSGSCPGGTSPIGKPVVAIAGDTVDVDERGVAVNGTLLTNSRPLTRDSYGAELMILRTVNHIVSDDELWLVSSHSPRSFDSRYFGPVRRSDVRARLSPVLVER
jgi:conjugative transfer signal peptidase TraF